MTDLQAGAEPAADHDAWVLAQLKAWPTRIHRERTINIEYLMKEAAKRIDALQSEVSEISIANEQAGEITQLSAGLEAAKEALHRCHERFVDYEKLHAAKGTVDGYAKADRNREMADMCAVTLERLSKAGDPAQP